MAEFDPATTCGQYEQHKGEWERNRDFAEMPPHTLTDGDYLDRFGKGSTQFEEQGFQYEWRKQASINLDYIGQMIGVRMGNLFRAPPVRRYEDSPQKEFIEQFLANVDGEHTSMDTFMAAALRAYYINGVDIVVEKAAGTNGATNRAQEREVGSEPFVTAYGPLDRYDWAITPAGRYNWVRYYAGQLGAVDERSGQTFNTYLTYGPDYWRKYLVPVDAKGGEGMTVEEGTIGIGEIPVIQFWFARSTNSNTKAIPVSLLTAISPIARALYNLMSEARVDLYRAMGIFVARGVSADKLPTAISPNVIIGLENPEQSLEVLAPDVPHIIEKRAWCDLLVQSMERLGKLTAGMGGVQANIKSGLHAAIMRTDLDNELATTAQQAGDIEGEIIRLAVSRREGKAVPAEKIQYSCEYNTKFVIEGVGTKLEEAKAVFDLDIAEATPGLLRLFLQDVLDGKIKPTHPLYKALQKEIDGANLGMLQDLGGGATEPEAD